MTDNLVELYELDKRISSILKKLKKHTISITGEGYTISFIPEKVRLRKNIEDHLSIFIPVNKSKKPIFIIIHLTSIQMITDYTAGDKILYRKVVKGQIMESE